MRFQRHHKLPETSKADLGTWWSLVTSNGDPNRPATGADASTRINSAMAQTIYNHGYRIVGRYLTNLPGGMDKAITVAEAEILFNTGLRFFPIFQEQRIPILATYFTPAQGVIDAEKAIAASLALGIPRDTIIYFAVDFDVMDHEITSNIIPYFRAIHERMAMSIYRVGIYGPRNACIRVGGMGYSVASFVSNMSAGFSGNLGFPMPNDWAFDQFIELHIGQGDGRIGIDRNGVSGRDQGVSFLEKPVARKAIYILPGYLGSELYDSTSNNANRLWTDIQWRPSSAGWLQISHDQLINPNLNGSGEVAFAFGADVFENGKDAYGADDTYEKLVRRLKSEFGRDYDVIFFPYNWLGCINDSVARIEQHVNGQGYDKISFVTHSTGGLLAAAYIAKSQSNKLKVEHNILIAPPLFGTYAALCPLERGDSRKGIAKIDIATNNNWVRSITHNSPTTYQLLPSSEYFASTNALQIKTNRFGSYGNRGWSDFYSTLTNSSNINSNLLSGGNPRSHQTFREERLGRNIIDTLLEVNTTIIGTVHGKSTPRTARYSTFDGTKLTDIKYDKAGDGTVYNTSLGVELNKKNASLDVRLNTIFYSDLHTGWFSGTRRFFTSVPDHVGLVDHNDALNYVVNLINGVQVFAAQQHFAPFDFTESEGMAAYVKLRVESDKEILVEILDDEGEVIAWCDAEDVVGFDGNHFICDQFGDDGETLTSVYLPKEGHRVAFYYGDQPGVAVDLSVSVNVLDFDGNTIGYGEYIGDITVDGGRIFTMDLSGDVGLETIEELVDTAEYDVEVSSEVFDEWETDLTSVTLDGDVIVLDNLGDTAVIGIIGDIDPALISWSSSDESVVTIVNGTLTATGYGWAVITVSATDGSWRSEQFHVKVSLTASGVSFNDESLVIEERKVITPIFDSENVTETMVNYTYDSGAEIILIEDGIIFGLNPGIIEVTGIAPGGSSGTFTVTVSERYIPSSTITVTAESGGTATGGGTFLFGTEITLTATPNVGYIFDGWYEDGEPLLGLPQVFEFEVVADRTLTATFRPNDLEITGIDIYGTPSAGNPLTIVTSSTGGVQPLLWTYDIFIDGAYYYFDDDSLFNFFEWIPKWGEDYSMRAYATDATGYSVEFISSLTVSGEPPPQWGHVTGQPWKNAGDVTALRRYIAASDKEAFIADNPFFILANADANGDGKVDAADVTLLRRYLAATDPTTVKFGPQRVRPLP